MLSDSLRAADGVRLIVCEQDLFTYTKSYYYEVLIIIGVIFHPLMIIACGTLLVMSKMSNNFKCIRIYILVLFLIICLGMPVAPGIHSSLFFIYSVSFINFIWGETTECNFGLLRYQLFLVFVVSFETFSMFVVPYIGYVNIKTIIKSLNTFSVVRQSDSLNEDHDSVSEVGYKTNQCNH